MDIDDKSLGVAATVVAVVGLVISHIVQVFRTGKEQGRIEGKIAEHDEALHNQAERLDGYAVKLETMQSELDDKLNVWFEKIDGRIESIESQFITTNGEPRFVSHKQHEIMQAQCQLHVLSEIGHVNNSLQEVREDVNVLTDEIKGLTAGVAVLSDRKD